ncbi:MAG: helix-turn-helix transcriptional regulator [Synergistaceae bacterium]|nr:helix-turn-helix transcriptional regulator [Synergistaceae bacterium]
MIHKHELPECPAATAIQLIGSKWKLLVIRELLIKPCRFNELKRSLSGISHKVLTESLRSMELDGLISRKVYNSRPPCVEYQLSELGMTLKPVLHVMEDWGKSYKEAISLRTLPASEA